MVSSVIDKVKDALSGVDFPVAKDELIAAAQRQGADDDVIRALRAMPPVDYRQPSEVLRSIDVHPAETSGGLPSDKARQKRGHTHRGIADHMTETERSPIEETLGSNERS